MQINDKYKFDENLTIWFDIKGIDISSIEIQNFKIPEGWEPVDWKQSTPNPKLGDALEVDSFLEIQDVSDIVVYRMNYTTNENQTAISWLSKEQTYDKTMEYLYSQCEDIACRSLAPMQDTPANKFTWTASVSAPNGYSPQMSGNVTEPITPIAGNYSVTKFECTIPVPSYLIAIAVGDLYFEHLNGGDINVITEPGFMSKVLNEFSDLYPYFNGLQDYFYKNQYPWG